MTFCIITNVSHIKEDGKFLGYAPYTREMNIWLKYTDHPIVVGPIENRPKNGLDQPYEHNNLDFWEVPSVNLLGFKNKLKAVLKAPYIMYRIYKAMKVSDHIHLRFTNNMGLFGSIVQILFPKKPKTVKYSVNFDPKAKRNWSNQLQTRIVNNTFLSRNMQVLVYGVWPNSNRNIKSFFTATYSEKEKEPIDLDRKVNLLRNKKIEMLFIGTLQARKRPVYAIRLAEALSKKGCQVRMRFYGEGEEQEKMERYIAEYNLSDRVFLDGFKDKEQVKTAYKESHFSVLPSRVEGWPKAVAEAMFWGCLPVTTPISAVPFMTDNGQRGVLLSLDFEKDVEQLMSLIEQPEEYEQKIVKAVEWSRAYTIERFDAGIKELMSKKDYRME